MINFKLLEQQTIDRNYQGICLSRFSISDFDGFSYEQLLDQFIHSPEYSLVCLREQAKHNTQKPFLKQAFYSSLLSFHDFKSMSKAKAIEFLVDFENGNDWGETDLDDFVFIKQKFLHILSLERSDRFFIITKDWFEKGNAKIRQPEDWVYIYYFHIIWIDQENSLLSASEWTYD